MNAAGEMTPLSAEFKALPVSIGDIILVELQEAARKLKKRKAPGIDEVPSEFWRVILLGFTHPLCA